MLIFLPNPSHSVCSCRIMQNVHHHHLLPLLTFSNKSSILNGLAITSFIPASVMAVCCSSLTFAVTPIMLTFGKSLSPSNFLISLDAVLPSMTGISWSIRTQSNGGCWAEERAVIISSASFPFSAVVTWKPLDSIFFFSNFWLIRLSCRHVSEWKYRLLCFGTYLHKEYGRP